MKSNFIFLDERALNRRPIPVITSDWISTPRSQLSAFSGTYFLSGVEQLEIQRIIDLSTRKSHNLENYILYC